MKWLMICGRGQRKAGTQIKRQVVVVRIRKIFNGELNRKERSKKENGKEREKIKRERKKSRKRSKQGKVEKEMEVI